MFILGKYYDAQVQSLLKLNVSDTMFYLAADCIFELTLCLLDLTICEPSLINIADT